jgi:Uma2 family endonuclease
MNRTAAQAHAELELSFEEMPNLDNLALDDKPAGNVRAEKQERLLTESLYASWPGPGQGRPFQALANIALVYALKRPALVPNVLLSLDLRPEEDLAENEERSYFVWLRGKAPEVAVEFVADLRDGESTARMREYARCGVPYYVLFDADGPSEGVLRVLALREGAYEPIAPGWLARVGLGLTLWEGSYEGTRGRWLRWCDRQGRPIPTGRERAEEAERRVRSAESRARQERRWAERLAAQLRALGVEPSPREDG